MTVSPFIRSSLAWLLLFIHVYSINGTNSPSLSPTLEPTYKPTKNKKKNLFTSIDSEILYLIIGAMGMCLIATLIITIYCIVKRIKKRDKRKIDTVYIKTSVKSTPQHTKTYQNLSKRTAEIYRATLSYTSALQHTPKIEILRKMDDIYPKKKTPQTNVKNVETRKDEIAMSKSENLSG